MKKQKWRQLDAIGIKLFKEMLITYKHRVDSPNLVRAINEAISVKLTAYVENEFTCIISFNESDTYELGIVDHVHQAQKSLLEYGVHQHPIHAVKSMTDLWKLYSKKMT